MLAAFVIQEASDMDPIDAARARLDQAARLRTINSAERIRHAATIAAPDPTWSPALTADSLSQSAVGSTAISHHCHVLLRALATRARQHRSSDLADRLSGCTEVAAQARVAWLHAARAWYRITTDTCGTIAPAAAETADLALWTGRLAYADPDWTPALGPAHATRAPEILAPEPGDIAAVVAAVHQASETLTRIAETDHDQIRAAAQARRLLVPTRSLPDHFDIPHPFAPAPPDRVDALLAAYDDAAARSAQATHAVATIATDVRAPSTSSPLPMPRPGTTVSSSATTRGRLSPYPNPITPPASPAPSSASCTTSASPVPSCWNAPPPSISSASSSSSTPPKSSSHSRQALRESA
jgi:hypothetical protein